MKHWAGATPPNRPEVEMEELFIGVMLLGAVFYIYGAIKYIDDTKRRSKR